MKYLSAKEILILHALIIDETDGSHGVRDLDLLKSIVHKPQAMFGNQELYRNLFHKAAIFLEALANYHVFIDGNKRTAFVATARFLFLNGYEFDTDNLEVETMMVAITTKSRSMDDIESWLKKNSRRI